MSHDSYRRIAASVFALVALMHALRVIQETPVLVGATAVPVWVSWLAVAVAGSLSVWGFRSRS
jgi:hypothetical protein